MLGAINWHSFFFLLSGGLACGFALAVLLSTNVVRMAAFLIASLTATAGLFFLAYVRDVPTQFVAIQNKLSAMDTMMEYIVHTGSALFAVLPGATKPGVSVFAPLFA